MEIDRNVAVRKLENASVGLTTKAILEQSNCFVFSGGSLITFNGEILTRQGSPFGGEVQGAVLASDFLRMMQRFPDEKIDVECRNGEILIKAKRKRAGIKMQDEILLPFSDVMTEFPKTSKISEGIDKILLQAARVCGKDETTPKTTHVHITPDRVESTDTYRIFRAEVQTNFKSDFMIHSDNVINVCRHKLKGYAQKNGWCYFLTEDDMEIDVLCSSDEYYEKKMLDRLLAMEGDIVSLPKNLDEILSRAEVMDTPSLSIGGWDSKVTLTLSEGQIKITSRKEEGWYRETKKVRYEGPEITFTVHPTFLRDLIEKTREVIIGKNQLKVKVENIQYTTALENYREDDFNHSYQVSSGKD